MNEHDATELAFKNGYEKGKQEVAREIERIFDGKKYVPYPLYEIVELKKKYTEEKT